LLAQLSNTQGWVSIITTSSFAELSCSVCFYNSIIFLKEIDFFILNFILNIFKLFLCASIKINLKKNNKKLLLEY
jgi:hypothetical protein